MVSKRRATSVVVFSTHSRRRSVSRARNRAMARFVRARRLDPRRARARRCCNRRSRLVSPALKARNTQQLPVGQRHRYRHAAIHTNNAGVTGSRDRFGDGCKSDVPTPRSIQSDSVRLHRGGDGAGPPKPHPPDLGYPYLAVAAAQPLDVARFESDLPKSFMGAGLAPRRATVGAVEKVAHRLREVAQAPPQAEVPPAAARSATRLPASRIRRGPQSTGRTARGNRAPGGLAASAAAARRPDSTQTGHDDSVRPTPPPAHGWGPTEICTHQQHREHHRQPVERRDTAFPRLKPRISTPQAS